MREKTNAANLQITSIVIQRYKFDKMLEFIAFILSS